jgi:hypothetical protein
MKLPTINYKGHVWQPFRYNESTIFWGKTPEYAIMGSYLLKGKIYICTGITTDGKHVLIHEARIQKPKQFVEKLENLILICASSNPIYCLPPTIGRVHLENYETLPEELTEKDCSGFEPKPWVDISEDTFLKSCETTTK